jgi:protein-S-isoprenylcysteine O-methyltransferase Ste14
MRPQLAGVAGLALFCATYAVKLRKEERFLVELFGEQYVKYQGESGLLFPL